MWFSNKGPQAVALVAGGSQAPCLSGLVKFCRTKHGVLVTADICGLPVSQTGVFALHIHEGATCGGKDFSETGGHYNPSRMPHPMHAGDLPPLFSCHGRAFLSVLTDRFCIEDVVGKTVVIHGDPDDFHSQPAGNAGTKIACGVICAGETC